MAHGSRQRARAHGVEREQPGAALQDAEAQQDGDRADVRHQQVEEAGAADLGDAVLRRDQEVGRQGHRLPGDHERVGVVGQQHESHAGEEQVVLEPQHARCGAFALAEVARPRTATRRRTRCRAAPGTRATVHRAARASAGRAGRSAAWRARPVRRGWSRPPRPRRAPMSAPSGNSTRPTKRRCRAQQSRERRSPPSTLTAPGKESGASRAGPWRVFYSNANFIIIIRTSRPAG